MPLLEPDNQPQSVKECGTWLCRAVFLMLSAAFLFWNAERIADPDWVRSTFVLKYIDGFNPFWRGAFSAILGSWFAVLGLVALWISVRPFTPAAHLQPDVNKVD